MRLVIDNSEDIFRIILAQRFQLTHNAVGSIDNICTAGLINLQRHCLITIDAAICHSTLILRLHVSDLPQLDIPAACALKLQMLYFLRRLILRLQADSFF